MSKFILFYFSPYYFNRVIFSPVTSYSVAEFDKIGQSDSKRLSFKRYPRRLLLCFWYFHLSKLVDTSKTVTRNRLHKRNGLIRAPSWAGLPKFEFLRQQYITNLRLLVSTQFNKVWKTVEYGKSYKVMGLETSPYFRTLLILNPGLEKQRQWLEYQFLNLLDHWTDFRHFYVQMPIFIY